MKTSEEAAMDDTALSISVFQILSPISEAYLLTVSNQFYVQLQFQLRVHRA